MAFRFERTSTKPSNEIKFYPLIDKLIEFHSERAGTAVTTTIVDTAISMMGSKHIESKSILTGNIFTVIRTFVDEAAFNEYMDIINNDPDHTRARLERDKYNEVNGIISEVCCTTV